MTKLTREQKAEIYWKRKNGTTIPKLVQEYGIGKANIQHLISLIDRHGLDILKAEKNRSYSLELKMEIINKVLIEDQSIRSTAIEYGILSNGLINQWIKSYKENGYVIVEKTKRRASTMNQKTDKQYDKMTSEEKIRYLEGRNQRLEAENEYLKKLRAVVQARKNRQQKKR